MSYTIPWGTKHPGLLVYLIDLSGSMSHNKKIDNVIEIIESVSEFLIGQSREHGNLLDRFSISIIGYNSETTILFPENGLYGSIIDLDNCLEKAYNEKKPFIDKEKEAKPQWQTFTAKAFRKAAEVVRFWISNQEKKGIKQIPVPIVIHITDGYPYEGENTEERARKDALQAAEELKAISVPDGSTLLFNIHIEPKPELQALSFPNTSPSDEERKFLFEATSVFPEIFTKRATSVFPDITFNDKNRFMVSNESDKTKLAKLIAFGSVVSSLGNKPFTYSFEPPKPTGDVNKNT